uniref:Putative secreted protein n=1 Tax=Anopheles darlingi TaxID=43151 RepID=A0A2M4DET6_ANODA
MDETMLLWLVLLASALLRLLRWWMLELLLLRWLLEMELPAAGDDCSGSTAPGCCDLPACNALALFPRGSTGSPRRPQQQNSRPSASSTAPPAPA